MMWRSGLGVSFVFFLLLAVLVWNTEAKKKGRKFDGDFEFADEEETKLSPTRKEGKKTWILDPGSDLCQALKCKKKELCLLEDEFTAVCVSKKELHKNGDVIVPKSKVKESPPSTPKNEDEEKDQYEEDEDDDSDYYEDDDSVEEFFSATKVKSEKSTKSSPLDAFKSCTPCPVVKPTFLCGSDNRTYSSLCRLDYHNCIQNAGVTVGCKGFCPCKDTQRMTDYAKYSAKKWVPSTKTSKFQSKVLQQSSSSKKAKFPEEQDTASGAPLSGKDRYAKYKDYYGYKTQKSGDKQRTHNEVINIKPAQGRDCSEEALESMGNRLVDWFSVVMADTQKRKLNRRNRNSQVHFPSDCKREVQWMFGHMNTEDDGQLSLQELYDLENDRNERCIKPFLDRCDVDKDVLISPREWCSCFSKICRGANCDRDDNELDDDDDSDIDGSSGDGGLDI